MSESGSPRDINDILDAPTCYYHTSIDTSTLCEACCELLCDTCKTRHASEATRHTFVDITNEEQYSDFEAYHEDSINSLLVTLSKYCEGIKDFRENLTKRFDSTQRDIVESFVKIKEELNNYSDSCINPCESLMEKIESLTENVWNFTKTKQIKTFRTYHTEVENKDFNLEKDILCFQRSIRLKWYETLKERVLMLFSENTKQDIHEYGSTDPSDQSDSDECIENREIQTFTTINSIHSCSFRPLRALIHGSKIVYLSKDQIGSIMLDTGFTDRIPTLKIDVIGMTLHHGKIYFCTKSTIFEITENVPNELSDKHSGDYVDITSTFSSLVVLENQGHTIRWIGTVKICKSYEDKRLGFDHIKCVHGSTIIAYSIKRRIIHCIDEDPFFSYEITCSTPPQSISDFVSSKILFTTTSNEVCCIDKTNQETCLVDANDIQTIDAVMYKKVILLLYSNKTIMQLTPNYA